jgi:hypothetical protein
MFSTRARLTFFPLVSLFSSISPSCRAASNINHVAVYPHQSLLIQIDNVSGLATKDQIDKLLELSGAVSDAKLFTSPSVPTFPNLILHSHFLPGLF